jgi:hypothetical protein
MPAPEKKTNTPKPDEEPGFLASQQTREANSRLPWIIAAAVVIVGLGVWIVVGTRANPDLPSTGTGMAPADPYAASLPISGLQMSEADTFSGAKVTYIDGQITNTAIELSPRSPFRLASIAMLDNMLKGWPCLSALSAPANPMSISSRSQPLRSNRGSNAIFV